MKKAIAILLGIMLIIVAAIPAAAISSIAVKSIKLDNSKISLNVRETSALKVTLSPSNTTQTKLTYVTTNKNVVSVNAEGEITGVHEGNASITIFTSNKAVFAKCEVSVKPLKQVQLRFYFPGAKLSATNDVWNTLANKFNNVMSASYEVNFIPYADYKDKLMLLASSGDKWDMNYDAPWQAYTQMQNKGAYMDITELLPKYAPDLYKKYLEGGNLKAATVNGKIMALPWTLTGNTRPWFAWRSDAAQKAGITIAQNSVKTIKDVDNVLHQLKNAFPDQPTLAIGTTGMGEAFAIALLQNEYMYDNFHSLVYKVGDPTATLVPVETTQMFRDTAKLTRKWVEDGIVSKDEMVDKVTADDKWNTGKVLARQTKREYSFAASAFTNPTYKFDYSELYPNNKYYNRSALGNCMLINKNAANPERALMFMNMVETNPYFYNILMYGIEGKTYVLNGDSVAFPSGMTSATSNYMNWQGQWGLWKPQFMKPDSMYSEGFWKREADYAKQTKNIDSPLDGLFFATDNIKNEIARRDQLYDEFARPLIYGNVKTENIDKYIDDYIAKQKTAGIDKILPECQKQISDFLAAKK